jgi:hypothetical protein
MAADRTALMARYLALSILSSAAQAQIIADHAAVDQAQYIPDEWISQVKRMWVSVPGESHSLGYRKGCELLEAADPRFQVNVVDGGIPEAYTDQHLRIGRATWGTVTDNASWAYGYGEEDWFTSPRAIAQTRRSIAQSNTYNISLNQSLAAMGFGWCWDMTWNHVDYANETEPWGGRWGSALDYHNGSAIVRQQIWGFYANDTPNDPHLSLADYLNATGGYDLFSSSSGYPTRVFYTTGPVDGNSNTELGLGRDVKHQAIRDHVAADPGRVLFDYADILCHNDSGGEYTASWNGHPFPSIHPDNMKDLGGGYAEDGDHIGERGALRLGKAMWWMLARIAGWDGTPDYMPKYANFTGGTTNFSSMTHVQLQGVAGAVLEVPGRGRITFASPVNFSGLDADGSVSIGDKSVSVDSSAEPRLDVPAELRFLGVGYSNPALLRDGAPCGDCALISYEAGVLDYSVPHFCNYTVAEADVPEEIYVAREEAGAASGEDCANARSVAWFAEAANWGPGAGNISSGDTVRLCGAVTASGVAFRGGGQVTLFLGALELGA